MSTTSATEASAKRTRLSFTNLRQFALIAALLLVAIGFTFASEHFLTVSNLMNVVRQMSVTTIVAVGMTFVIISGGIDLSVGAIVAFSGVMAADVLARTGSPLLAVGAALAIGLLAGTINGFVTAKFRIAGFITTLSAMQAYRGFGYIYTNGNPIPAQNKSFTLLGVGYMLGVPVPVWIMAAVVAVGAVVLRKTRFGRYTYAVGGNEVAARWTGLPVERTIAGVYILTGALAGLAGAILTARLGSGQPAAGQGLELDAIAAVVLGGTSLAGGRGKISGTVIGCILVAVLSNGLTLLNVSSYWQMVVKGLIIVVAVVLDTRARAES
ncbi:MAG TPA: ribose ABC transporter permease [Arachnia sp.]|nr:ribose ABC transporter permease [Arachnia sp.]